MNPGLVELAVVLCRAELRRRSGTADGHLQLESRGLYLRRRRTIIPLLESTAFNSRASTRTAADRASSLHGRAYELQKSLETTFVVRLFSKSVRVRIGDLPKQF